MRMTLPARLLACSFLLCSAAPGSARAIMPAEAARNSALHGYILGRYAAADNALADATRYFDAARQQDPARPVLAQRTFDMALASGDQSRAFALARQLQLAGNSSSDIAMVALADEVLRKDWPAVDRARAGLAKAGYAIVLGPIIEAWTLFGRGDRGKALSKLDPTGFTGFSRSYVAEQRAHMLAADGQWQAAATAYAEQRETAGSGISFLRQGEADALAMAGQRDAALAVLTGDDAATVASRARLQAGKRIGPLAAEPRRAIAWATARLATDLSREKPVPPALLFARVATFLAPDMTATLVVAGDVLLRSGLPAEALVAFCRVPAGDSLAAVARARQAEALEALGQGREAGAMLAAATTAADADADDWSRLGDWHRRADRFGDAGAAYGKAIAAAGQDAPWSLYFLRGSMAERAGNWPAAEADLREALKRSPDEPVVLNYLGYSALDRNVNLAEANQLIARAAQLRPADGGIIDSLGWSHYRAGHYADAVAALEQAVLLEPADPTVFDHLGDAYWRSGRRIDARFRWRVAIDLDPDAGLKSALQAKLDYGLDAAIALAAVK